MCKKLLPIKSHHDNLLCFQQKTNLSLVVDDGLVDARSVLAGDPVHVHALLHEQLQHLAVPVSGGEVQGAHQVAVVVVSVVVGGQEPVYYRPTMLAADHVFQNLQF